MSLVWMRNGLAPEERVGKKSHQRNQGEEEPVLLH